MAVIIVSLKRQSVVVLWILSMINQTLGLTFKIKRIRILNHDKKLFTFCLFVLNSLLQYMYSHLPFISLLV